MSDDLVLDVRDLSVGYVRRDGSTDQVVERVSFTLERGRILGLAGESGCGKSTTALAAIGYRSPGSRIRSGESRLDGVDMLAISTTKLRKIWGSKVAYVAQSAALALNPAMTVGRQLAPLAEKPMLLLATESWKNPRLATDHVDAPMHPSSNCRLSDERRSGSNGASGAD